MSELKPALIALSLMLVAPMAVKSGAPGAPAAGH
jgi:hypothetical protein